MIRKMSLIFPLKMSENINKKAHIKKTKKHNKFPEPKTVSSNDLFCQITAEKRIILKLTV